MLLEKELKKKISKSFLYRSMLEDIEEQYKEKCLEDGYANVEEVVIGVLDQNTENLMEDYFDLEKDEDDLKDFFYNLLINDFDGDEIDSMASEGGRYNGLSVRERNPFLQ